MAKGTTIVAVKRGKQVAIAGDGQITVGDLVMKHTAKKLRTLYQGKVIAGFAGAVADTLTLFERFEHHLDRQNGQLKRAAVALAKEWRTDRYLRRLEAWLVVANSEEGILVLSGEGDVIEPDRDAVGIGSGGAHAQAAATALLRFSDLSAAEIARSSLEIAADLCIYTNRQISVISLEDGKLCQTVEEGI